MPPFQFTQEREKASPFIEPERKASPFIKREEDRKLAVKAGVLDVFEPFNLVSKIVGSAITGKPVTQAPTVFELAQEKAKEVPVLGQIPAFSFIIGFAAEAPLFGGAGARKKIAQKSIPLLQRLKNIFVPAAEGIVPKTTPAAEKVIARTVARGKEEIELGETIVRLEKQLGGAVPETAAVAKELEPLAQEARKFKSAEEFIKSQSEGKVLELNDIVPDEVLSIIDKNFASLTGVELPEKIFKGFDGISFGKLVEGIEKLGITDDVFRESTIALRKRGYGRLGEILLTEDGMKTKSQLTDFFNKVRGAEKIPTVVRGFKEAGEEFIERKRGIISDKEVSRLAKGEVGILDKLVEAPPGTVLNVEQLKQAEFELAERISLAITPEELLKIGKEAAIPLRATISETARALRSVGTPRIGIINKLLKAAEEAKNPIVQNGLIETANILSLGREVRTMDKIVEWATAIKLTSLTTDVKNILGNTLNTMIRIPERFVAGGLDFVGSAITGRSRERFATEAISDVIGMTAGLKEGARNAVKALADETFALQNRRIEEFGQFATGAIGGRTGKVIRAAAFRKLTAEDLFFRTISRQGSIYAQASRQAFKEGLSGAEFAKRVKQLVDSPTADMIKLSKKEALKSVFQEDLQGTVETLNRLRAKHPWVKLILPFFKTPVNIAKVAIERTPFAPLLPSFRKAFAEGGGARAEALSRVVVGSAAIMGFINYAQDGLITGGGPKNLAERDALYRKGWQPYSIKIGDHYISYRGLEPFSSYLNIASNISESFKEPDDATAIKLVLSIAEDFLEQPFLLGVSDLFQAIEDPERSGAVFLNNFVSGAFIPTGVSWINRGFDPVFRKPRNVLQAVESRIPFLSENVPARLNVFGEEVKREEGVLGRISPLPRVTDLKTNPVEEELERLNITVGFPSKVAFGKSLDDDEYDILIRNSGKVTFMILNRLVNSEGYKSLNEAEKERAINRVTTEVRNSVREKLFQEKLVIREIEKALVNQGHTKEKAEALAPEVLLRLRVK